MDLLALIVFVLVSFLRARGGVTTAGMGLCVCVCDGLCLVWRCNSRAELASTFGYFWLMHYGLTPQSSGRGSEATAQLHTPYRLA